MKEEINATVTTVTVHYCCVHELVLSVFTFFSPVSILSLVSKVCFKYYLHRTSFHSVIFFRVFYFWFFPLLNFFLDLYTIYLLLFSLAWVHGFSLEWKWEKTDRSEKFGGWDLYFTWSPKSKVWLTRKTHASVTKSSSLPKEQKTKLPIQSKLNYK